MSPLTIRLPRLLPAPCLQALVKSNFALAERCAWEAGDLSGLLLLYTSLGDGKGLLKLANKVRTRQVHTLLAAAADRW